MSKCLYCYKEVDNGRDFHEKCSLEFFGTKRPPVMEYTIDQMSELAKEVIERSVTVPGVQAKLSMSMVRDSQKNADSRLTVIGALGGEYIFKPPVLAYPEMPQNEHLTMRLAELFRINTVPSSLIRLASGELSYITRRIDRNTHGDKIHMIDMFQVTEAFDKYRSSYERIGKAIGLYSINPMLDKLFYFEMLLFCFLTGNNDMHLKNFSMIQADSGWILAPAYDLLNVTLLLPEDDEELALTLAGKKKKLMQSHFRVFGEGLGLTPRQIEGVFKRFLKTESEACKLVNNSFLSDEMKEKYIELVESRFARLSI